MLIKGNIYTAEEILVEAGVTSASSVFGSKQVIIGGLSNIRDPKHLIKVASPDALEVVVDGENMEVEVVEGEEDKSNISNGARAKLDELGQEILIRNERNEERKRLTRERENYRKLKKFKAAAEVNREIEALNLPLSRRSGSQK